MRQPHILIPLWLLLLAPDAYATDKLPAAAKKKIDFGKDIRPLLQKHCVSCHGNKKQESGLRLDRREFARSGGDRGVAFEAGKSRKSLLIRYIAGLDPDITMPPKGDLLSPRQVGLFLAWIDQGADWPASADPERKPADHWAYQPLKRPATPALAAAHARQARNPIDHFVLRKLGSRKLNPSDVADRYTLVRRLSLDLLGLPPSREDVDRFVSDKSPDAYEHLVDRLLRSPHFGERWGRHWLDKARYADSDGYEKDRPRPNAWRWRDWVIDAINRDLPFDQFTLEQLAGDLLPKATESQRLATAFHRQTLTNTEGGTDKEQWRVEAVFDRVETTGTVWLGLTVGCARCHSHKYDQISQREYYQIFAFYNNGDEVNTDVTTSAIAQARYKQALTDHAAQLTSAEESLRKALLAAQPALKKWIAARKSELAKFKDDPIRGVILGHVEGRGTDGTTLVHQKDRSWLVSAASPEKTDYTITGTLETDRLTGLRLEVLTDKTLPKSGPGRAANGNFVLNELIVELSEEAGFSRTIPVRFTRAEADFSQADYPVSAAIDGKPTTGWAIAPQMGKNHVATFYLNKTLLLDGPRHIRVRITQQHGGQHSLGRFRLTPLTGSQPPSSLPKPVQEALGAAAPNKQQLKLLEDHFATVEKTTAALLKQIAAMKAKAPKPPRINVRVIQQRAKNPRTTYVLQRGDFLQPQKETPVIPLGLGTLPALRSRHADSPGDRLDLARWLVSDDNPLTPRVAVNHIWSHLFGRGLVGTINDFGVRGDRPSHPKLLDWLASEFRHQKWSRKALIKTILLSATYRQASRVSRDHSQRDPENRWLGRQNRFRVEAEIIRDNSLAAAGLLSAKVGGPSVFPPMPADVAALSYANNFKWKTSGGPDRFRRGLYTFFKRTAPHPNLTTFDCPDSNTTCVERRASNTPLQALATLNNEVYVEASRSLARRVLVDQAPKNDPQRITIAFRHCVARPPTSEEVQGLSELLVTARTWYSDHAEGAKTLVGGYTVKGISPAENAAWVATCRILLNMDEFITRE